MADYTKAIELNPDLSMAYNNRGSYKLVLEDHRGAIEDLTKAIELNPNYSEAYFGRGLSKFKLNKKDSAYLDFSKAGELGNSEAYDFIKECYK